ncbi:MAG: hypothetical protein JXQ93_12800 [Flavobacteriaceae bacterium]
MRILKSFYSILFITICSIHANGQNSYYESKSRNTEHIELSEVYNKRSGGKRMTVIVLDIVAGKYNSGVLNPPGSDDAFYLVDNNEVKYKLIKQEGWKGNKENGYGYKTIEKDFSVKLFFEPIKFKKITKFNLIEGNARQPWTFYGIRYSKDKTSKELEELAIKDRKRWYYSTGELMAIGNKNKKGEKNWKWTEYHKNGKLSGEGLYSEANGQKTGAWKEYYENSQLKFEGAYESLISTSKSEKHGLCLTYWPNGKLKEKTKYRFGEIDGTCNRYHESGEKKEILSKDGSYKEFFLNGNLAKIGQYNNGKKAGLWKHYYDDEKIKSEVEYVKNKKYALWKEFDTQGRMTEESIRPLDSNYKYKHREHSEFNEKGLPKKRRDFDEGQLTQEVIILQYHENKKIAEAVFIRKVKEKVVRQLAVFSDEDKLLSIAELNNEGQRHGKLVFYYKNQQIIQTILMKNGKWMEILECYDLEGNQAKKGTLKNGNGTVLLYDITTGKENGVWNIKDGVIIPNKKN